MATRPYPSFLIYIDASNQFRWRFQAANYKTTADSAEAYQNFADCLSGIQLLKSPHPIWQTDAVTARIGG